MYVSPIELILAAIGFHTCCMNGTKAAQTLATKLKLEADLPASCFAERGYAGVSSEELVAKSGTSPEAAFIYHHYDGKEGRIRSCRRYGSCGEVHAKLVTEKWPRFSDPLQALERGNWRIPRGRPRNRACREYCSSMRPRRFLVGPSGARWMRDTDWG